jgi:hypothetical protein
VEFYQQTVNNGEFVVQKCPEKKGEAYNEQ